MLEGLQENPPGYKPMLKPSGRSELVAPDFYRNAHLDTFSIFFFLSLKSIENVEFPKMGH